MNDSRTSQYDTALPSRGRRYVIDTVATTSAAGSSPELTPATSNATSGSCSRKVLEAVPELDTINVVHANPEDETVMNKEKTEIGRNSNAESIQSLMEEGDMGRPSSQPSPIPPVDNLKYLSVSPPRSCASLTVRATPRAANEISTRFVIYGIR